MKILPETTFTPLFHGLVETMDWFVQNYPEIRK